MPRMYGWTFTPMERAVSSTEIYLHRVVPKDDWMELERFVVILIINFKQITLYKSSILFVQKNCVNQTKVLFCFKYLRALSKLSFKIIGCEFCFFASLWAVLTSRHTSNLLKFSVAWTQSISLTSFKQFISSIFCLSSLSREDSDKTIFRFDLIVEVKHILVSVDKKVPSSN